MSDQQMTRSQLLQELGALRDRLARVEDDRLRTEKALRDSEARFQAFLDHSPVIAFLKDRHGRYVYFNRRFADYFRKAPADLLGKTNAELFPPDAARYLAAADARAFAEHRPVETVESLTDPDGAERSWLLTKFPVQDAAGHRYLGGIALDVTERRHALEALREQQALLRNVLDHIPCAVFWKDRAGAYLGGNENFARDAGAASPAALVGMSDYDLPARPAEVDFYRRCDREVMATGRPLTNVEETQRRADGRDAVLLTSKVPLRDAGGQVIGVLGVYTDITDRKRAEDRLAQRERLFRAVIEAAGAVPYTRNYVTDAIEYVGPGIAALLGCPPEAFTPARWNAMAQEVFLPGRPAGLTPREAHDLLVGGPATSWRADVRARTADGQERWLFNAAVKLVDPDGTVVGSWGLLQDITERKRLEEQARHAEKMDAVGRLAGGVAHDFNNLLTVINGYSELLLDHPAADDPMRRLLGEVRQAGERAAGLTQQLLAFGQRLILQPRVLGLNAVVVAAADRLRQLLGPAVELALDLDPQAGDVRADPAPLEQVLLHLAANARAAMPEGGTATVRTAAVDLPAAPDRPDVCPGPYVRLSLTDTGVGLTDDVKARLFEPFFTTKEPGQGSGLGLATVYGIVAQAGGYVEAEGTPGRGATFHVYLPRVRPAAAAPAPAADPPAGPAMVVLVEDETAVRAFLRTALAPLGYALVEAADGAAALQACAGLGRIDLLITDVVMPGMGGPELAERLAARYPGLRVLFLSGYLHDAAPGHGTFFLPKPFRPSALAQKVREILGG